MSVSPARPRPPSADTHATARPAAASVRRCKKRNDRVGHSQQRVDRRAPGEVAVHCGVGCGKRRGAPGEGEVVQRGEDHRGMPLARRRRLNGAQRLLGLAQGDSDALVQRRCSGGVDLTEVSVDLSERAGPTHG